MKARSSSTVSTRLSCQAETDPQLPKRACDVFGMADQVGELGGLEEIDVELRDAQQPREIFVHALNPRTADAAQLAHELGPGRTHDRSRRLGALFVCVRAQGLQGVEQRHRMFIGHSRALVNARLRTGHLAEVRLHGIRTRLPRGFEVPLDLLEVHGLVQRGDETLGIVGAITPAEEIANGALRRARQRAAVVAAGHVTVAASAVAIDPFSQQRICDGLLHDVPEFVELSIECPAIRSSPSGPVRVAVLEYRHRALPCGLSPRNHRAPRLQPVM